MEQGHDVYMIWVDLADSSQDLEFAEAIQGYLGYLQKYDLILDYSIERRKFGFAPESLGEFHIRIHTRNLDQLDRAFQVAARREEPLESLHANVFRRVVNFKSALYRPFPDPFRTAKLS